MVNIESFLLSVEKPGQYLGNEINSVHKENYDASMCLFFPDIYEVGMSNLGIRILYDLMNKVEGFSLERGFSPMADMEEVLRENDLPLFSLESKKELSNFDILGFSLSYEMSYTNVLNALDLAKIPLEREKRDDSHPLIMAGGTCTSNPAPMSEFIDFFMIGDGEESMVEIAKVFVKNRDKSKQEKLELIKNIEGVYIPSIHKETKIKRAIVKDLNKVDIYSDQIVPFVEIVHDRAAVEIQRGCTRGCRFCQAGMVYRPVREKTLDNNLKLIEKSLEATGYSEVSLSSLSSSDYTKIGPLLKTLQNRYGADNLGIALPSLRMNPHSVEVAEQITSGKKTGFTFAPEAGSQRLRDVINKGVNEEEILETAIAAVKAGWHNLKFYFMIGLPFETDEDVKGIHDLATKVIGECRKYSKRLNITVSVSNFVPKPHTPFQWAEQMDIDEMIRKHDLLRDLFKRTKYTSLKIHDKRKSFLEGILSRGDQNVSKLIKKVWEKGGKLEDGRNFRFERWTESIEELRLDTSKYLGERDINSPLPWDMLELSVTKEFLLKELKKAEEVSLTQDCREGCLACGVHERIDNCGKLISDNLK